jgi:membrane protein YdbS with pleckstrin-like domain
MYPLDPRFIQVEVIGGIILTSVVSVLSLIGVAVLWVSLGFGLIWYILFASALGLIGLLTLLTFVWPKIEFKHYHWRLDEQSLEIHRGVWFKHRISVPLGRVQHADVSQGPLLRRFDLGKLTIHTAGTANAQIELAGLSHHVALKLRDRLVQQAQSRVVT